MQMNRASEDFLASLPAPGALVHGEAPRHSPLGRYTLLYQLSSDIGEQRNLADDHPEIVSRLTKSLDEWEKGMIQPTRPSMRTTATRIDGVPVSVIF